MQGFVFLMYLFLKSQLLTLYINNTENLNLGELLNIIIKIIILLFKILFDKRMK